MLEFDDDMINESQSKRETPSLNLVPDEPSPTHLAPDEAAPMSAAVIRDRPATTREAGGAAAHVKESSTGGGRPNSRARQ